MALSPGPALEDSARQCLTLGIPKIVDGLLQLSETPSGVSTPRYSTYSTPHRTALTSSTGRKGTCHLSSHRVLFVGGCVCTRVPMGKGKKEKRKDAHGNKMRLHPSTNQHCCGPIGKNTDFLSAQQCNFWKSSTKNLFWFPSGNVPCMEGQMCAEEAGVSWGHTLFSELWAPEQCRLSADAFRAAFMGKPYAVLMHLPHGILLETHFCLSNSRLTGVFPSPYFVCHLRKKLSRITQSEQSFGWSFPVFLWKHCTHLRHYPLPIQDTFR